MPRSTKTHRTSDVPTDEVYRQVLLDAGEKYGFSEKLVGDIVDVFFQSLIRAAAKHGEVVIPKHAKVYYYMGYSTITLTPIPKLFFKWSRRNKNLFKGLVCGEVKEPDLKHSPVADTLVG